MFNILNDSLIDKREEWILTLVALVIPMLTLPSMIF